MESSVFRFSEDKAGSDANKERYGKIYKFLGWNGFKKRRVRCLWLLNILCFFARHRGEGEM